MTKENFMLQGTIDSESPEYWFMTDELANEILKERYQEPSLIGVPEVGYIKTDGTVGLGKLYRADYRVVTVDDEELRRILSGMVEEIEQGNGE